MAFDSFLKLDGIDGESTDKAHPNEIVLESFSWGESNPTSVGGGGSGGGAGRASIQDFHFTMATSKATPNLMLACAVGRHFPTAKLTCRTPGAGGGFEFMKVTLADVVVSLFQLGAHPTDTVYSALGGDENTSTDEITLSFGRIDILYTVQRTGESIETSYDLGG
jgi:type VI secretion system secreted protein Hcp